MMYLIILSFYACRSRTASCCRFLWLHACTASTPSFRDVFKWRCKYQVPNTVFILWGKEKKCTFPGRLAGLANMARTTVVREPAVMQQASTWILLSSVFCLSWYWCPSSIGFGLGPPHPEMPPASQELLPTLCAKQLFRSRLILFCLIGVRLEY